jgi:tRNA modification GTPase
LEAVEQLLPSALEFPELIAVELRRSLRALEIMVGRIDVESLLDEIFSSFCIGK